jgi:hypothetical protein
MAFTPKAWANDLAGGTPLSGAALADLEQRVTSYADGTGYANVPVFSPSTAYVANFVIQQGGLLYSRNSAGTSGASFAADAANWTVLGSSSELGYTAVTSTFAFSSTSWATAVTCTVTVGSRPVMITGYAGSLLNMLNTYGVANAGIFEDGVQISQSSTSIAAGLQYAGVPLFISGRSAPAAGSHTYTLQMQVGGAGQSMELFAQTFEPIYLQVVQL